MVTEKSGSKQELGFPTVQRGIKQDIDYKGMNSSSRRLISVDLVRGLAIIGVLFIHPTIYGNWHSETLALQIVPYYVILIFLPLILLGTWGGGFPLLSGLVNTYTVYNRLERGVSFKDATIPILISSTILILLDPLKSVLFGRTWTNAFSDGINYSVFSQLVETGKLSLPNAERLMTINILASIGLSGYMTVFFLWLLFRKGGREKTRRNVFILLFFGLLWAGLNNPISELLNPYVKEFFLRGGGYLFLAYLLRLFIGAQLSFFPMGIYAVFGIICGYLLVQKQDYKLIKRYGFFTGLLFLLGFVASTLVTISSSLKIGKSVEDALFGILDYEVYPRELLFFSLGSMLLLYVLLVKKIEYQPESKKEIISQKTRFFRRFGVATLTLYMFEPVFNGLLATLFHFFFNGGKLYPFNVQDPYMTNVFAILLFEFTFLAFWFASVYFWSKTGYKYGFEYLIIKLQKPFRKTKTSRLQLD